MEAHSTHVLDPFARKVAVLIAVLAGLLAVATLLSNEAAKESINSQTKAALTRSLEESNEIKAFVGSGDARELGLLAGGETSSKRAHALRHAAELDAQVAQRFVPRDRVLTRQAAADEKEHEDEDEKHFRFELATVALEVGIVLGSIAIITRFRALVAGGIVAGMVGAVLVLAGLLV